MSFGVPEALLGTPWAVLGAFWAASRTPLMSPGGLLDAAGMRQDAPGPLWTALGPSWKPLGTIFEAPNVPKMRQVPQTQCSAWFSLALAPECAKLQLLHLRNSGSILIPDTKQDKATANAPSGRCSKTIDAAKQRRASCKCSKTIEATSRSVNIY